ncbi:hypothetical protein Y032_0034g2960 [Ancylostoma ceylanicum]|nr:hypothetical protein Y032_0034g2960 [Ancylostoma ceylanicum]
MLSSIRCAALESVAQCRAISSTSLTRCFDPRCIRPDGYNPIKEGLTKDVDPAFVAASMFVRQSKSQEVQSADRVFRQDDPRQKRPSTAQDVTTPSENRSLLIVHPALSWKRRLSRS